MVSAGCLKASEDCDGRKTVIRKMPIPVKTWLTEDLRKTVSGKCPVGPAGCLKASAGRRKVVMVRRCDAEK